MFRFQCFKQLIGVTALLFLARDGIAGVGSPPTSAQVRMVEWTIESKKAYTDPFNDVDVDVIFTKDCEEWRVPTFWRGGQRWTVRFAPPTPGRYAYRLVSTDAGNPDLNGHNGAVDIIAYRGINELLRHGNLRVSTNGRYFEHADGTPFYWLGDTWWTGLSDRLSWEGFQKLTGDRKAKGFTVVQIVAGLIAPEELPPIDPGYGNEGGPVWDAKFQRINPQYFDFADRRIQHLIDAGLVPVIVGAWRDLLTYTGVPKMKKHWRYVIARYGAYPVLWSVGGEVFDPPNTQMASLSEFCKSHAVQGWTEVAKYLRATDSYHHPITAHEYFPGCDPALQDESQTDFDLFQSGHADWWSLANSVAQFGRHYARTSVTKPLVQGEIGYEKLGETHLEDFQRAAFWLSMLNGAAGHTYGAVATWESYTSDKPFQRMRYSFLTWEEGMNLPGSYQVGLGAKLLRRYRWWRFAPHPEWVIPRGTTLLEPQEKLNQFDMGSWELAETPDDQENAQPASANKKNSFRRPYAAGIAGEVRVIYMPYLNFIGRTPPTILGLERGVRYQAYFWQPSTGIRIDVGAVERPEPGGKILEDSFTDAVSSAWIEPNTGKTLKASRVLAADESVLATLRNVKEADVVAAVETESRIQVALVLRYQDTANYVAAVYSPAEQTIYVLERRQGEDGQSLGGTAVSTSGPRIQLSAEVRGDKAIVSINDGRQTFTSPIVDVAITAAGGVGLLRPVGGEGSRPDHFEVRRSPPLQRDGPLPRKLYDARGIYRGELTGEGMRSGPLVAEALTGDSATTPGWSDFGKDKHILLDAYRPERMPTQGDWVLVLDATTAVSTKNTGASETLGSRGTVNSSNLDLTALE